MSGSSNTQGTTNQNATPDTTTPDTTGTAPTEAYDGKGLTAADVPEGMTISSQVDIDGDGDVDVAHLADGQGGNVNVYLDQRGDVILAESDTNTDGVIDTLTYQDEDGLILQETDANQDGRSDYRTAMDEQGNTVRLDVFNEAGTAVAASVYDTNADGIPDLATADLDGDGVMESALYDTDHDGVADTVLSDTDGDGVADTSSDIYGGPDAGYEEPSLGDTATTYGTGVETVDAHDTAGTEHLDDTGL